MPGTYVVDTNATFVRCVLINGGQKDKFGVPGQQETSSQGIPKWFAEAAVTFVPSQPGMPPVSELITVTITSYDNPFDNLSTSEVTFEGLRVGNTAPSSGEGGRIRGGKFWFTAAAVRPALSTMRGGKSETAA
jgi:hypothetical protein